jgi:hypothetical protein
MEIEYFSENVCLDERLSDTTSMRTTMSACRQAMISRASFLMQVDGKMKIQNLSIAIIVTRIT